MQAHDQVTGFDANAELGAWLDNTLAIWDRWARQQGAAWLALPTGNPVFPVMGAMFAHAFTPLLRYAGQLAEAGFQPPAEPASDEWPALHAWATECLQRYRAAAAGLSPVDAQREFQFMTRSAGAMTVTPAEALFQAGLHCAWHLAGLSHLLRAAGIDPPAKLDYLFFAAARRAPAPPH